MLGFDEIGQYQSSHNPYFGATVGRVANRIRVGHFSLGGVRYNLTVNNNGNTLHGGTTGWDKNNWKASVQDESVVFRWRLEDQEDVSQQLYLLSIPASCLKTEMKVFPGML